MIKLLKYLKKYWFYALLAPIFMLLEVLMDLVITIHLYLINQYLYQLLLNMV